MMADDGRTFVNILVQSIELVGISKIVQTEVLQDTDGLWVREFRFFGVDPNNPTSQPQNLVVRVKDEVKNNLLLTTPALQV
jgi:hypothetical protein